MARGFASQFALALLLVLPLCPPAAALRATLRVAFAYLGTTSDLGWNWRHNQGRIYVVTKLMEKYPTLDLQAYYQQEVPETGPPNCDPVFEQWAQAGMDLIIGTSFGHQFCMAALAPKYPNTVFFHVSGFLWPNVSNWGLGYAWIYQPTYLAGMVAARATQTGRIGAVLPIRLPETARQLAAFALGVARVNASIQVHVGWTGDWLTPPHEVWNTQRLADLGCDVVFHRTDGIEGVLEAIRLNQYCIGFNADHRMLAGENVLISPYFNWGILYQQVAEMVLNNSYSPVDLYLGLDAGAVALSDPSFYVKRTTMAEVAAVQALMQNRSWDPFCGPIETNANTVVGVAGHCANVSELTSMMWQPKNVVDHGYYKLPGEACAPGEFAVWRNQTETFSCIPCPGGTIAVKVDTTLQSYIACKACSPGQYAPPNSTVCSRCPAGAAPSPAQDACPQCPAGTYSGDGDDCLPCPPSLVSGAGASACTQPPPSLTAYIAVGAVAGSLVLLGLSVAAAVIYRRRTKAEKVLRDAPSGQLTLMFTDVQSSTLLWDRFPEGMSWALEVHNEVIREQLREHRGYEVKTIGDSFMVAFPTSNLAVSCAIKIQQDLLLQSWPEEMGEDEACATVCTPEGKVLWRGLRVRMGLHCGTPEPRVNRSHWRVDYFGPPVNLAARVESKACGGQILVTAAVYDALAPAVLERGAFRSVGPQQFKGVSQPVEVYSVLPENLTARVFPEVKENLCVKCLEPMTCGKCDGDAAKARSPRSRRPKRGLGQRLSVSSVMTSMRRELSTQIVVPMQLSPQSGRSPRSPEYP